MKLSEYRDTHSWQGAIELGPQLMQLAEELPAAEELGLSWQLRQVMVELPAAIATDLLQDSAGRHAAIFKLVATLDLIERVYPALDTHGVRTATDKLAERLTSKDFSELPRGTKGELHAGETADLPNEGEKPASAAPVITPAVDAVAAAVPAPAPASVPVVPEPTPAPTSVTVAAEPATTVPVTPQETNVQPNSGQ